MILVYRHGHEGIIVYPDGFYQNWQFNYLDVIAIRYHEDRQMFSNLDWEPGTRIRIGDTVREYFGLNVFDDGFFVSDKESTMFMLKCSGNLVPIKVDLPLL